MAINKYELILDTVFKESYGKNKLVFEHYKSIYDLEHISVACSVSKKLFDYCLRKKYFILLLIYNDDGKIFLNRSMSDNLYWDLPGGSIKDDETINQSLVRIAKTIDPKILIGNVEPVITIENKFEYNGQTKIHQGIGFIARLRNNAKINNKVLIGDFIDINDEEIEFINRNASKKIVEFFRARYKEINKKTNECFQEEEISTNEKYATRYKFHNKFIKRYVLTDK